MTVVWVGCVLAQKVILGLVSRLYEAAQRLCRILCWSVRLSGSQGVPSVFRWRDMKVSFELAHEVALIVVAYLCHNLLDTQESGC